MGGDHDITTRLEIPKEQVHRLYFTLTVMAGKVAAGVGLILLGFSFAAAASKPNLVLITLDSARADRMGFLGAKGGLTPNLDRLAGESIVFEHAYAQAPSSVVSHATILSGAYPQNTGMSAIGGTLSSSLPYLPDLLKAQGYRTAAFVGSISNELDPQNGLAQGFGRGFQTYAANAGSVRADQVVARATAWLTHNAQSQFFLWIQLAAPSPTAATHNAAITAEDAAIGKLLALLKQQKLEASTAILITAAHGESFGAHGEETHGIFLYDETIQVPLLVRLPEATPAAKRVTTKVRLIDIAPTLLEIAGVSVPPQMQGQSLLRIARAPSAADLPVYSRSDLPQRGFGWSPLESWRVGKYLYIRAPRPELYDLTADSAATHNLAQTSKATLDTMAAQLENFDRHFTGESAKSTGLSSSEMQRLASLGYVGLQKSAGSSAAVSGTDPKDKIAIANQVLETAEAVAQGRTDRAIAALTSITAADPNLYLAQYALGVALSQKGQYAEAVKHLHKAIELQPEAAWAHYAIGTALLKTGDAKTAAIHLEIATQRLPEFAPARIALAEARHDLDRR